MLLSDKKFFYGNFVSVKEFSIGNEFSVPIKKSVFFQQLIRQPASSFATPALTNSAAS